jgi:sirohydrochlorin cobaltochelatase
VAYIELQRPTIEEALAELASQGKTRLVLSPALLFAAGHAKQDIPQAVATAKASHPQLQVRQARPLECHEAVLELAAQRFAAAHGLHSTDQRTALVLVGRGSSDAGAIDHCRSFATSLATRVGVDQVFTGFLAMAEPSLAAALEQAAASGCQRIVVQPHLLFHGEMLESTRAAIANAAQAHPQMEWLLADNLGSDLLAPDGLAADHLTCAIQARVAETCMGL